MMDDDVSSKTCILSSLKMIFKNIGWFTIAIITTTTTTTIRRIAIYT